MYFEQSHVEEELKDGEYGNVEVDVYGHPAAPHELPLGHGVDLLSANHREDEEHVRGEGHDLEREHSACIQ